MLLRHYVEWLQHCSNIATLCCAKNRRCEWSFVTSPLLSIYLFMYLQYLIMNEEYFTFHLQYKHSGTFANRKSEELFLPQKSENVRPHYSQSRRENATPSSGASPLASYKEVPPPGMTYTRD